MKALRVGIEIRQIRPTYSGGIVPHLRELLQTLFRQFPDDRFFVFATFFNSEWINGDQENCEVVKIPWFNYYETMEQHIEQRKIDVLFRSYPDIVASTFPMEKQVVYMPDLQHELLPELFQPEILSARRRAFSLFGHNAGAIVTLSYFVREQICNLFRRSPDSVLLTPPSLPSTFNNKSMTSVPMSEEVRAWTKPRRDYLIYPANLWPHKNHAMLFAALKHMRQNTGIEMPLILTGYLDSKRWEQLQPLTDGYPVSHLGYVNDWELVVLLRNAKALVFPSRSEGFGMPVLEAFACEIPVACARSTSLPEIAGNGALFFDPDDVDAIADAICRILTDEPLRNNLRAEGTQRLSQFTWEQSAENLRVALAQTAIPHKKIFLVEENPLVSVVTPSYNQGRFIKHTIDSILRQSYPHIEYMVMDGGSTDETISILKSYGDRFSWISEPDRGQTHAINKGFHRSRGSILSYLNSDDTYEPHAVESIVNYLGKHPQTGMVYGHADYINEENAHIEDYYTEPFSAEKLQGLCYICQPASFFRHSVYKTLGPLDESLRFNMDYEYWLRMTLFGIQIEHLPELIAHSRLYRENKTLAFRRDIYLEIFHFMKPLLGYVHPNYSYGYLNHLCQERRNVYWLLTRVLPSVEPRLARIHHRWINKDIILLGFLNRHPGLRKLRRKRRIVEGYYLDDWLGPKVRIRYSQPQKAESIVLCGTSPKDMEVTVRTNGGRRMKFFLKENERCRLEIPARDSREIVLRFSDYIVDPVRRKLSFLITHTDLFTDVML